MLLQSSKTLAPSNIFQAFRKREARSSNCQPSDKCTWLVIVRPRKIRVSSCRKLNPKLSAVASKKNSSRQTAAWLRSRSAARLSCQSKKGRVPRTGNYVLSVWQTFRLVLAVSWILVYQINVTTASLWTSPASLPTQSSNYQPSDKSTSPVPTPALPARVIDERVILPPQKPKGS